LAICLQWASQSQGQVPGSSDCDPALLPPWGSNKQIVSSPEFLEKAENYLKNIGKMLAKNDSRVSIQALEAGNTTKTSWKVKLACNKKTVANLKCSFKNTYAPGEIAKYKLGKELGFNIFPVSIPAEVNHGSTKYVDCTLKLWAEAFSQLYYCGQPGCGTPTFENSKSVLAPALQHIQSCSSNGDKPFLWSTQTAYGFLGSSKGRIRYSGSKTFDLDSNSLRSLKVSDAAQDFSNLMILDALTGEEDRGPSGNVHIRDEAMSFVLNKDGSVTFPEVRLFALDNGGCFKSEDYRNTFGMKDVKKYVNRFDRDLLNRLEQFIKEYPNRVDDRFLDFKVKNKKTSAFAFVKGAFQEIKKQASRAETCDF